jgi:FkbM family methyltransferase
MLTPKSILRLATPPYLFRPQQALKRLWREFFWRSETRKTVILPWGLPITVNPQEAIGSNIANQGLYESGVTETLWILTDAGDIAVDAGANIGYMTSIFAIRVGSRGKIISFEPHPVVFARLRENVNAWATDDRCGEFLLYQAALGVRDGTATLRTDDCFATNKGTAWIQTGEEASSEGTCIEVMMRSLDSVLEKGEAIGILKLDVQGSEMSVLEGMTKILESHAVRDIVFEEMGEFPAPTHQHLKSRGYSIFGVEESLTGVRLLADTQPLCGPFTGAVPNYLATLDPNRAKHRLCGKFWRSFGPARVLPRQNPIPTENGGFFCRDSSRTKREHSTVGYLYSRSKCRTLASTLLGSPPSRHDWKAAQ